MNGISLEMTTPHTLQISKRRHWALALLRLGLLGLVLRQKKPHAWVRAKVSRSGGTWITVTPAPDADSKVLTAIAQTITGFSVVDGVSGALNSDHLVRTKAPTNSSVRAHESDPARGFRLPKGLAS